MFTEKFAVSMMHEYYEVSHVVDIRFPAYWPQPDGRKPVRGEPCEFCLKFVGFPENTSPTGDCWVPEHFLGPLFAPTLDDFYKRQEGLCNHSLRCGFELFCCHCVCLVMYVDCPSLYPLQHVDNEGEAERRDAAAQPEMLPNLHGLEVILISDDESSDDSSLPELYESSGEESEDDSAPDLRWTSWEETDDDSDDSFYNDSGADAMDSAMNECEDAANMMDDAMSGLRGLVNDLENMCDDF